jgi:hypothetical protein
MQFDITSKTTWALVVAALAGVLGIVGVTINADQISGLVTAATYFAQGISIVAPIVGAIYHQISKKNAQKALVQAGVSHDDAKAATKS